MEHCLRAAASLPPYLRNHRMPAPGVSGATYLRVKGTQHVERGSHIAGLAMAGGRRGEGGPHARRQSACICSSCKPYRPEQFARAAKPTCTGSSPPSRPEGWAARRACTILPGWASAPRWPPATRRAGGGLGIDRLRVTAARGSSTTRHMQALGTTSQAHASRRAGLRTKRGRRPTLVFCLSVPPGPCLFV